MKSATWRQTFEKKSKHKHVTSKSLKTRLVLPRRPRSRFFRLITWPITHPVGRILIVLLCLLVAASLLYILRDLPSPTRLASGDNFAVSTQILDRNGKLLYEVFWR